MKKEINLNKDMDKNDCHEKNNGYNENLYNTENENNLIIAMKLIQRFPPKIFEDNINYNETTTNFNTININYNNAIENICNTNDNKENTIIDDTDIMKKYPGGLDGKVCIYVYIRKYIYIYTYIYVYIYLCLMYFGDIFLYRTKFMKVRKLRILYNLSLYIR
jgi:hypothetical protein